MINAALVVVVSGVINPRKREGGTLSAKADGMPTPKQYPTLALLSNTLHQTTASWLSSLGSVAERRIIADAEKLLYRLSTDRIAFPRTALAGAGSPRHSLRTTAAITHGGGDEI